MTKRGLSPVVATTLLISLVIVLGLIIFIWALSFFPEVIIKFDQDIRNSCQDIAFDAEYGSDGNLLVQNKGNIPIYGVDVAVRRGIGSLEKVGDGFASGTPILGGATKSFEIGQGYDEDNLVVVPLLLGTGEDERFKAFACEESSIEIEA